MTDVTHDYVSTACQHDLHDRCRRTCKWCPAECRCACHRRRVAAAREERAEPGPTPVTDRVVDLMAALEQSVAAAKAARRRHLATGDRVRHPSKPFLGEGVVRGRHQGLIRVQWDDRSSDDLYPPDKLERLT